MSRYLDPKADVVFKKIFGEHPKLLISFLNVTKSMEEEVMVPLKLKDKSLGL